MFNAVRDLPIQELMALIHLGKETWRGPPEEVRVAVSNFGVEFAGDEVGGVKWTLRRK